MRIIAGKYKGRRLVSFQADHIRPTTDRVKETLFNILQGHYEDSLILDLFAGTGNLGLEALSREAKHVVFVEKNPKSIEIISKNLQQLQIEKSNYSIVKSDVFDFFKKTKTQVFDLIFIDPPFTEKMADKVMSHLALSTIFKSNTIIAIESVKGEKIEEQYGELIRFDKRDYGDKVLSLFQKSE